MVRSLLGSLAVVLLATNVQAAASLGNVDPTRNPGGAFISGSGIPANNFWIDNGAGGEQVALKARGRDGGQPIAIVGNRFYVRPGMAVSNPARPWWSLDYQFAPAETVALGDYDDYYLRLEIDFDPAFGVQNFSTREGVIVDGDTNHQNSWDDNDSLWNNGPLGSNTAPVANNPASGQRDFSDNTPWVVNNSAVLSFGEWATYNPFAATYNPFAAGEYLVRLTAFVNNAGSPGALIAQSEILVEVTPEPASMLAWAGLGLCLAGGRRWRKRKLVA